MKKVLTIASLFVMLFASVFSVSALSGLDMNSIEVELSGRQLDQNAANLIAFQKGDNLPVEVCFIPTEDKNLYFEFAIVGGDYRDLDVRADTGKKVFYKAGVYDCAQAEFSIKDKVEIGNYTLRVFSFDKTSASAQSVADYDVYVTGKQDEIVFEKISIPNKVMAGRSVHPIVFVRNNGREDEDRVDITAELVSLSGDLVAKSNIVSVEDLEVNEGNKPSDEMLIEVPAGTVAGTYEVRFVAEYDRDYSVDTYTTSIVVEECLGECLGKTISKPDTEITPAGTVREVGADGSADYKLSVKNEGSRAVTYTIEVNGLEDLAVAQVSPSNFFTLEATKAKDLDLTVTPLAGLEAGNYEFDVEIKANSVTVDKATFVLTVLEDTGVKSTSWTSIKNGLQIGFIVLLVLLIILALIVTLNRVKGNDGEDDDELKGQTYY